MLKNVLLAGAASIALAAVTVPAHADNIILDQWYTGHFTNSNTPLLGNTTTGTGADLGTNGPTLSNTNHSALQAPITGSIFSATITMPTAGGYVTITDVEDPGDQFNILINGVAATPYGFSQLVPSGQAGLAGGDTSAGCPLCTENIGENISAALSDPDFSSGTFYLPGGADTITGTFLGTVNNGNFDMIAEAPEPASMALLGAGLAGLGFIRRRKR